MTIRATKHPGKIADHRVRERAYDDGYAGRPARSALAIYQRSWRLGVDARSRDEDVIQNGDGSDAA